MAPPSQIAIATSSLQRLVKEEGSYHKELKQQETRLEKLVASKDEDENAEFQLKQEVGASRGSTVIKKLMRISEKLSRKPKPSSHLFANASQMLCRSSRTSWRQGMPQKRRLRRQTRS